MADESSIWGDLRTVSQNAELGGAGLIDLATFGTTHLAADVFASQTGSNVGQAIATEDELGVAGLAEQLAVSTAEAPGSVIGAAGEVLHEGGKEAEKAAFGLMDVLKYVAIAAVVLGAGYLVYRFVPKK